MRLYDQAFVPQSGRLANGNKVQPLTGNNIEFGVKRDWAAGVGTALCLYTGYLRTTNLHLILTVLHRQAQRGTGTEAGTRS
jgi:hypothetical protein